LREAETDFEGQIEGAPGRVVMAIDDWNGTGDWNLNPTDWSLGAPPSSVEDAAIQSGDCTVSTSGQVDLLTIISGADLSLTNAASLRAGGLVDSGSITVQGEATNQTTLDVAGAAPRTLRGSLILEADALLEFGSGGITTIGAGASLTLYGAEARVSIGAGATNSALRRLQSNAGTLDLEGDNPLGAGGGLVTTKTGLNNSGTLEVDTFYQVHIIKPPYQYVILSGGGSSLRIGGALTNSGTVVIGNGALKAPTTVTASGLINSGSITLQGGIRPGFTTNRATLDITGALVNSGSITLSQATLDIAGAAPSILTGSVTLKDDSLLEFGSGGITAIGAGASLALYGGQARVSIGAGATDSALTGLSSNAGTFDLEGESGYGAGSASLTTTAGLTNSGTLDVDILGDGSKLTLGGVLANTGSINIGTNTGGLYATTVTAGGLVNTGSISVGVGVYNGPGATLDITAAAPSTATGSIQIGGDGLLEFASGGITAIGAGASFELDGSQARVSTGADTTANSALTELSSNAGAFDLEGFSSRYGWGAVSLTTTTGFNNSGNLSVDVKEDPWGNGDGGSTLTLGGALSNTGAVNIGNAELWTTTMVTAKGLSNTGTIALAGASSASAQMTIAGQATNSGTVTIGAGSTLAVNGAGDAYTQHGGTTTVAGTLAARAKADGGLIDFKSALTSGDGTGPLSVGARGKLEFDAAVDSTHNVDFTTTKGTVALGDAGAFSGTVEGFAGADAIDLLGSAVIGLAYNATTDILTASGSGGTIATLHFSGSYTTSSFAFASDGHGGTNILHA
jgi:hypothetical protein